MKKLTILALTALAAAAITGCAQNKDATASADNGMAKASTCCGDKSAEAKTAGGGCCSGEAKAGTATCTEKAAQVK